MSIGRRTTFTINFEGGTEFQHSVMRESIHCMLVAWKAFYELKHKKNIIQLKEEEWKGDIKCLQK